MSTGMGQARTVQVAQARQSHAGAILELLKRMHGEASYDMGPVHDRKAMHHIIEMIGDGTEPGNKVWIAAHNGRLVGSIGATLRQPWWGTKHALHDAWFYVDREFRSTRAAAKLLAEAKKYAARLNMDLLMRTIHGTEAERKDHFFARSGFRRIGGVYLLEGD